MKLRQRLSLLTSLALFVLATFIFCVPFTQAQETTNSDVLEVRHYTLTLDKAQRCATAVQSENQLVAGNPALKAKMDATPSNLTITQQAQNIDNNYPQVVAIIRANGFTQTREFIVITGAIINDVGWVGMKKMGAIKAYTPDKITAENAALIEANWAQFQAIGAKMTPPSSR
jgi:methylmalonyl-CoA mutase cobalamin-binding subunit